MHFHHCHNYCRPALELVQLFWEEAELLSTAGLATVHQFLRNIFLRCAREDSFEAQQINLCIEPARFSEFRFLKEVTPTAGRWPRPSASMLYCNKIMSKKFFFDKNKIFGFSRHTWDTIIAVSSGASSV